MDTPTNSHSIKIVILSGSVRPGNYTAKAVALLTDEFRKQGVSVTVPDLAGVGLNLPGLGEPTPELLEFRKLVSEATALVLATPEYHGSFSSVIKLTIENMEFPSALAGKPVSLLGVAAGVIGAIKSLEALRSVCSHVGALVLPGLVSVAGVQKVFDKDGNCLDEGIEKRIRGLATSLLDYIHGHICPRIALEEMVRKG